MNVYRFEYTVYERPNATYLVVAVNPETAKKKFVAQTAVELSRVISIKEI